MWKWIALSSLLALVIQAGYPNKPTANAKDQLPDVSGPQRVADAALHFSFAVSRSTLFISNCNRLNMRLHMLGFCRNKLRNFGQFIADLQRAFSGLRTRLLQLQALDFKRMNTALHADNRAALLRRQHA